MLSGNLELFALADVLRFVARSGATGAVNIYRDVDGGRILLVDGEVVGAVVDDLHAPDADGVVDAAMRLIDGGNGDFALELEDVSGPTRSTVEDFLKAVGRRRGEWRKILASFGSLDGPLEASALIPPGAAEITLTPVEWHIAVLLDGRRSLREIAADTGSSEFATATALLAMSNAGLLSLAGGSAPDDSYEEPEDEDEPDGFDVAGETEDEPAASHRDEPDTSDDDLDPAELLRELGDTPVRPRVRRLSAAGRDDQRIRLRSR